MIRLADNNTALSVRRMWKEVFADTDEYIDLLFASKYSNDNTLLYFDDEQPVASLQMLPYSVSFYGTELPCSYLAGLCTLPTYRGRGYMSQLITKAHELMSERKIPLSILVPAESSLYGYYKRFGYEQVFDAGRTALPSLSDFTGNYPDLYTAYLHFDQLYGNGNPYVKKTFEDFRNIIDEYNMDGCPLKYNLAAMARIIDAEQLIAIHASQHGNNKSLYPTDDRHRLCRLLFGYHTKENETRICQHFPQQMPVINLMLE